MCFWQHSALKRPYTFSLTVLLFITRHVMSKRLPEETVQFSQGFTPDIGLCKSFYFSLINCAGSSVNHPVGSVLIYCRAQSYVNHPLLCQNEQEKRFSSVLYGGFLKFTGIVGPTMPHLWFK